MKLPHKIAHAVLRTFLDSRLHAILLACFLPGREVRAAWQPQGPFAISGGLLDGITGNTVSGAVKVVRPHPFETNTLYIAAVNGGVWKTTNAWDPAGPNWEPLTDGQPSLSMNALEFDPTDPTARTLVAAVGRSSAYAALGGRWAGLLYTADGGQNWSVLGALTNLDLSVVAARGPVLLAGTSLLLTNSVLGLYRSVDRGNTFSLVPETNGLPSGGITSLVGDPQDVNRFWVALPGRGVFTSTNAGETWTATAPILGLAEGDLNMLITFQRYSGESVLYVGIVGGSRKITALVRSADLGRSWAEMALPQSPYDDEGLHPESSGQRNFSLTADPVDPYVVYAGGDLEPEPKTGRLFRGDFQLRPPTNQWRLLTYAFSSNASAPHPDSRHLVFDRSGSRLIEADDGGIYFRSSPRDTNGGWFSLNGNLCVTEVHSVAWDPITKVLFAGTQDNGVLTQTSPGSLAWTTLLQNDGGNVAIATNHAGDRSSLLATEANFQFPERVALKEGASAEGLDFTLAGSTNLTSFFTNLDFYPLIEVNSSDPHQIAIGTRRVYIGTYPVSGPVDLREIFPFDNEVTGLAFGGMENGAPVTNVLYAAAGADFRLYTGDRTNQLFIPGNPELRDIALDPADWKRVFVCDGLSVYGSFDAGAHWFRLGGPPPSEQFFLRTLAVVTSSSARAIVIGGSSGVYAMSLANPGVWTALTANLPNAVTWDIHYAPGDDFLYAGLLGRGVWRLDQVSRLLNSPHLDWTPMNGRIELRWSDPAFVLETSADLQSWTALPGFSTALILPTDLFKFFRLVRNP